MEHQVMKNTIQQTKIDFSIVTPTLTLEAMRDSGYKDTNHALAELIDNSVEAKADLIEVIAVEVTSDRPHARPRVTEIAVVDNGEGMDEIILRRALRFGDGTKLDRSKRGIGRFGVGLPQSSISQCKRVDVWTWQNGASNAFHCFLDLDEINRDNQVDVPEPVHEAVPEKWLKVSENVSQPKGTLVVWSRLDRVKWTGGEKNLKKAEELCGRVYRKFLTGTKAISIRLKLCRLENQLLSEIKAWDCHSNDPLYLTVPSSTPEPFNSQPMFQLFNERTWTVPVGNKKGEIHVRCTMARPDAINQDKSSVKWPKSYPNPGAAPWGKHADRNKGISIVRAKRELELSLAWVNNYEPEERWWSVEVEFDPILDDIFGVVNNKQHAHAFVEGAGFNWEDDKEGNETFLMFFDRIKEDEDPKTYLIDVWKWINEQIKRMRKERENIRAGTRKTRHPKTDVDIEDVATQIIEEQSSKGEKGKTDRAPEIPVEEKREAITESALLVRLSEELAKQLADETISSNRRIIIKSVTLGHKDAFFDVESVNNVIELWLNNGHPFHAHLIDVLESNKDEDNSDKFQLRLQKAAFALKMLLVAWARFEDKVPSGLKEKVEDVRMDWGREARKFFDAVEL